MEEKYAEMLAKKAVESLSITRTESERLRMRKSTDRGTDVALALPVGTKLRHGDIVSLNDRMIVISIEPEKVAVVSLKNADSKTAVLLGHAIGNLHRPVKIDGERVVLPIQSDAEIEMLRRQLGPIARGLEITSDMQVFEPEAGAHEH
jgi:urease accessory protein